jgi:hypothetical protein
MSQINDALKQARQAPPRSLPNVMQPLQPAADESSPPAIWLIPAIVIVLIVAAIFFIGWAAAHNTVRTITTNPGPAATQEEDTYAAPVAPSPTATPAQPQTPPPPLVLPKLPKLQGIFYSTTAPTAILDGKTVSPGDQLNNFKVKTISKYTVTLIGPDKKEYEVGMGD